MPAFSRKAIVLFGLLIVVAAYCFAKSQQTPRTPVQELEAIVDAYALKYDAETNRPERITSSADQREIHVRPNWPRVELSKDGNASIHGMTTWSVSIFGWDAPLQAALLSALNDSPASAKQLVEHPDERIQFLLLKVLTDWGHDIKSMTDLDNAGHRKPWDLKPYAIEALLTLGQRNDPQTVGTVISALKFKGKFSTDVFLAGMAHNSSDIRVEALLWLRPEQQQLSSDEIQAVAPVLIDHLTDRDMVVRSWNISALQSLVAYWEQSLGGAPFDVVRTDQTKMIKLPIAPASNRWYHDVSPQAAEPVEQYQTEWKAWLAKAEESL